MFEFVYIWLHVSQPGQPRALRCAAVLEQATFAMMVVFHYTLVVCYKNDVVTTRWWLLDVAYRFVSGAGVRQN